MNYHGNLFALLVSYYNDDTDTFYSISRPAAEYHAERLLKDDDEVLRISITGPQGEPVGDYTRTPEGTYFTQAPAIALLSQADEDRKTVINLLERALSVLKQEEPK